MPKSLSKLFSPPPSNNICERCSGKVYYAEKVGPVNNVIFHKSCFRCNRCDQHLTMKTYFTNGVDVLDKEIYCTQHVPKVHTTGVDANAVGIRNALMAPKAHGHASDMSSNRAPQIGMDAMHIKQPVSAQNQFQMKYKQKYDKHHFPAYVVSYVFLFNFRKKR